MGNYLNSIYYGRDSYGIQAAAQAYFGVDASALTVEQAALLAGIIPSPNNWDPAVSPNKAEARWNIVLDSMVDSGWLTGAARDAMVFPPTIAYQRSNTFAGTNGYLLDMVEKEMLADYKVRRGQALQVRLLDRHHDQGGHAGDRGRPGHEVRRRVSSTGRRAWFRTRISAPRSRRSTRRPVRCWRCTAVPTS